MRMTNEEFQAEVFRRSEVYLKERQARRRRMFSGVLAMAGCFAIGITAIKLLPLFTRSTQTLMADCDNSVNHLFAPDCAENMPAAEKSNHAENEMKTAEEANEDACADAAEDYEMDEDGGVDNETAGKLDAPLSIPKAEDVQQDKTQNYSSNPNRKCTSSTMREKTPITLYFPPKEQEEYDGYFVAMDDAALFDYYGIAPLPETLAGIPYYESERNTESGIRSGVYYEDENMETATADKNLFWYKPAADSSQFSIALKTVSDDEADAELTDEIVYQDFSDRKTARFKAGRLYVTIAAYDDAQDVLAEAAESLRDILLVEE